MRRDIHSLFDAGYVTVTPDLQFRVSRKIKEEFENGRDYYAMDGQAIAPVNIRGWEPSDLALKWHSEERFLG